MVGAKNRVVLIVTIPNDILRILRMPDATNDPPAADWQSLARRGCTMQLRPIQRRALDTIARYGGLLAPIGVGHGKTLITLLAAWAIGIYTRRLVRPLLLVPGGLVDKTNRDKEAYGRQYRIHPITVASYDRLSRASGTGLLERLRPTTIICDECHKLRARASVRTRRLSRYLHANPSTVFVGLSGTITARSILDYAHLAVWALGYNTPQPLEWTWLESWANVIDPGKPYSRSDMSAVYPLVRHYRQRPRQAYAQRLVTTPGVVSTDSDSIGCSLVIHHIEDMEVPGSITKAFAHLDAAWELPGGEAMFDNAPQLAEAKRCVVQGFYYVWEWSECEPDWGWIDARRDWWASLRRYLPTARSGCDSPALVETALLRGDTLRGRYSRAVIDAWAAWQHQRHKRPPPVRTQWIDDYLIRAVVKRAEAVGDPVLIWYKHRAVAQELRAASVPPYTPDRVATCAASIEAHGTGLNLQKWNHSIVLCPPSSGSKWQQLLGRTHRQGQAADTVKYEVYTHADPYKEAMRKAKETSEYLRDTQQQRQKLLYATHTRGN